MPKKPSNKNNRLTVLVNGDPIEVTLYSPRGNKKTWYAYWSSLNAARSTGQKTYDEAVRVVESMVQNGGQRPEPQQLAVLSDEEFELIQRRHYGKRKDPGKARRALKSLVACLESISAFKALTNLTHVAAATPDDCEKFQHKALDLPFNWRKPKPKGDPNGQIVRSISPNTVVKWSTALQAAFERANRNAGKKCVRGVVPEHKLLTENPWGQFTWIEGVDREVRQFDSGELISLIDFFEEVFSEIPLAAVFAKICLWTWGRREEVSRLQWEDLRVVSENEHHFKIIGKWGVEKWARIPHSLYDNLKRSRTDSTHIFGDFPAQLVSYHLSKNDSRSAKRVRLEFDPVNLGDWMYRKIKDWQIRYGRESAYLHVFRKTTLQYARTGADINRDVASDARIGEGVMMTHYARVEDLERQSQSNRTYKRILNSLSLEVARRYGYEETERELLLDRLEAARLSGNWNAVAEIATLLQELQESE